MKIRYKRIEAITEGIVRLITTVGGMGELRRNVKQLENYGFTSAPREGYLALETKTWDEDDTSSIIISVSQPSGKRVMLNPGSVAMYTEFDDGVSQFHRVEMDGNTGQVRIHGSSISLEAPFISMAAEAIAMTEPPIIVESEKLRYTVPTLWMDCVKSTLARSSGIGNYAGVYMEFREQSRTVWVQGKFAITAGQVNTGEGQQYVILKVPIPPENSQVDMRFLGGGTCRINNPSNNSFRNEALFVDGGTAGNERGARVWLPPAGIAETMECNVHYTYKI